MKTSSFKVFYGNSKEESCPRGQNSRLWYLTHRWNMPAKTLQTATKRSILPANQFNHSRHGKEMNLKWTCHSLSLFQNAKNNTCSSLSLSSEKWGERKRFLSHCGGETYSLLQWTESEGRLGWQESARKYQYLKNQQFSGIKCFIVNFVHANGGKLTWK